jgi:RNA polymerase sigma-70 factor (ECF subfamily)
MAEPMADERQYLRLEARLLWRPGLQRDIDLSDVVQRTLLRAHEKGQQFRGTTEAERRAWLRAILRNELLQEVRGHPPGKVSLDESSRCWEAALAADQTSPSQKVVRHEEVQRLARALAQLHEDERTAIELKHLHGCSVAFISQHLGRTKLAVAGLLKRGLHKLRLLLGETS